MQLCDACAEHGFERECLSRGRCAEEAAEGHVEPEVWRQVPGYARMHHVSTLGRFRNMLCPRGRQVSIKVVEPWLTDDGPVVWLNRPEGGQPNKTSVLLSEVVLLTFSGPRPAGSVGVLHVDEDPQNVKPENLRWKLS